MQFQTLFIAIAVLASGVTAGTNSRAICRSFDDLLTQRAVFDRNATIAACDKYKNRNTGEEKWDKCPDCFFNDQQGVQAFCDSRGEHMGGNEWEEYCTEAGADSSAYAIGR